MSTIHESFNPLLDDCLMESTTALDVAIEEDFIYGFPTPPYDSQTSPTFSMDFGDGSDLAAPDDLLGELLAVNAGDIFCSKSAGDNVLSPAADPNLEVPAEDFNILEGFEDDLDDVDVTGITPTLNISEQCSDEESDGEEASSNHSGASEIHVKREPASTAVIQPHVLRPRASSSHDNIVYHSDDSDSIIRMDRVSQYQQSASRRAAKPSQKPKVNSLTYSGKSIRNPVGKSKFDINSVDIRKVAPSRKAAVQAKLNRERKKAYVQSLEQERDTLRSQNSLLLRRSQQLEKQKNELAGEAAYLRRVLFNDSQLAGLLQNIGTTSNIKLSVKALSQAAVVSDRKRKPTECIDHDYVSKRGKSSDESATSGGICLHVDQDEVTVEFCRHCSSHS